MEAYRNLIVPDAHVALARLITETLAPTGGKGMYSTGLSANVTEPATHWISSGYIDADYAALLPLSEWTWVVDNEDTGAGHWQRTEYTPGHPDIIVAMYNATEPEVEITLAEVEALLNAAEITVDEPFAAMARLGLRMMAPAELDTPSPA